MGTIHRGGGGCREQSLCHTRYIFRFFLGLGSGLSIHSSQLTFSDQWYQYWWYGPQSYTRRTWVRLPVLSHYSHIRASTVFVCVLLFVNNLRFVYEIESKNRRV